MAACVEWPHAAGEQAGGAGCTHARKHMLHMIASLPAAGCPHHANSCPTHAMHYTRAHPPSPAWHTQPHTQEVIRSTNYTAASKNTSTHAAGEHALYNHHAHTNTWHAFHTIDHIYVIVMNTLIAIASNGRRACPL